MRLSAGRIRAINRALARTHATAYGTWERNTRPQFHKSVRPVNGIPPHTIKIVAVPKQMFL